MTKEIQSLISMITHAARRPLPVVVERFVLRYKAGHPKAGEACPALPWGESADNLERAESYFVQMTREGSTVGQRFSTREELIAHLIDHEDKQEANFRHELENMTEAEIESQADYWLKRNAA